MPKSEKPIVKHTRAGSERPSSSGLLLFIAAFVSCLLIFAGIGALWWHLADPDIPFLSGNDDAEATAATTAVTTARFDHEDRFSIAVYITDDDGALQTVTLLMAQPENTKLLTLGLPAEYSLSDTDRTDTLLRRFTDDGVAAAHSALGMYLSKSFDYYFVLSYSQVESYFTQIGENLIFELPVDVNEQSADGSFSIHLTAGEQALTAKQVANLLRYTNWQSGRRERAQMHAAMVCAYMNQFLTDSHDLQTEYQQLYSTAQSSNLTGDRFSSLASTLSYLAAKNSGTLCTNQPLSGSFTGAGDTLCFTPDQTTVDTITQALR